MVPVFTIGVSTISFVGYDVVEALSHIADSGYEYVELAAVEGGLEHISQGELTPANAARLRREMERRGLRANALSAHSVLTEPNSVERFLPRLRFAADLGAPVCVTHAGPREKISALNGNLEVLIKEAEKLEVIIALETNADIVTTGADGIRLCKDWNSPWLGINYDPGNVYRATSGNVDPVEDFRRVVQDVKHVHLKDMRKEADGWTFCAPGTGVLNTSDFLHVLGGRTTPIGVNLELPYRIRMAELNGSIRILDELPSLSRVDRELSAVRKMVTSALAEGRRQASVVAT